MSGNARKRRSTWDNKEENQISARSSEQSAWQERESYPRHDRRSSDNEADHALKSKDFHEWRNREPSPRTGQRDAKRDSYDNFQSRRHGDVAKSYTVSPRNHGPGQQNHIRSPEGTWDPPRRRSRSRSRGRGRGRSRSPSRGRNRSRSLSRGREREREVAYGRSRSPPHDYNRREPHAFSDRRGGGFPEPPPQVCRNFTAGDCRRGSQCRFLHPDNRLERERRGTRGGGGERVGSRYDTDREELVRNYKSEVCNNFLKGRCRMGSACKYIHHEAGADNNSHERQPHVVAPCKFFLMGNCSRNNCRYSHDAPAHNDRETEQRNDRRDRGDYGEKNSTWNGPSWNETTEKRDHDLDVKDGGGWNGPTWHDVAPGGGSDVRTTVGWGDREIENADATNNLMIAERDNDDVLDHDQSKIRTPPDSDDMDLAGSDAPKEINKMDPQYQTPYDFQQPTSTAAQSVFLKTSQQYNQTEGNIPNAHCFDSINSGDNYANAKQITPITAQNFNQNSDMFDLPTQQFGLISQDQLVNSISINPSDERNTDLGERVQENISPFKAQNSIDTQYGSPAINHSSITQAIDDKPVQISNLQASLSDKFVNEQLPQLYAALNPPKPEEPMPSVAESGSVFPPLSSINAQPEQTSIYQKRDVSTTEPKIPNNSNQYPGFTSNSIAQNEAFLNNNHMKTVPIPALEESSKPITEKVTQEPENNDAGNVEKVGDGENWKDEKAMRLFKNSLVEFVKDILKPKWKEGNMTRDVHKAIVKKVVDKVTSATQGINIPSTQAKLDQYLQCSKPKLAKLVEAYIERFAKTS